MQNSAPYFQVFGRDHIFALVLLAGLGALLVLAGRKASTRQKRWIGGILAFSLLAYAATMYTLLALAGNLSLRYSLPLELCHWVMLACVIALLRPNRLACEVAYFWGFAGTFQAALTPDLYFGFPDWDFIQFFWAHGGILLAIVHLLAAGDFQPTRGSVMRMMLAVNFYALFVGTLDYLFGWNYGYLRHPPMQPSLLDYLGPWPWYLLSLEAIALASFWLLALPWRLRFRRQAP